MTFVYLFRHPESSCRVVRTRFRLSIFGFLLLRFLQRLKMVANHYYHSYQNLIFL